MSFDRFNFSLSFRPGGKNGKADSLSRMFAAEDDPEPPDYILPPTTRLGAGLFDLEQEVLSTLAHQPGPSCCPQGKLFVPENLRGKVIHICHPSRLAVHPGISRRGYSAGVVVAYTNPGC